ncbi:MAG TPA: archaellin/type IV pilin N-terminal domain-containing protein [Aggregatilineaceae bacterium]|jgi:flagellin FlaB|nr:archaellin/type IV pilin N-terminal domain-containing protein [Aggregatilineaceae bacterium]
MFNWKKLHRDESGQTALEAAIILIAFIVVASVFAFAVLSSGSKSTEKGTQAINAGLQGVQSSMEVKGAVIAKVDPTDDEAVGSVVMTLSLVAGGDPIDMNTDNRKVVVGYRDSQQVKNGLEWTIDADGGWLVQNDGDEADTLLEDGELVELTVPLDELETALGANTEFTLEIKPPTGAVINLTRTTPPAIEAVMELN